MVFSYSSPNWIDTCYFLLTSWGCPHWFLLQTVHQLAWDILLKYQVLLCFNFYEQLNIPLILLLSEVLSLFIAADLLIYCTSKSYLHTHTWKPLQQTKSIQFQRADSIIHCEPTLGYFHFVHFSVTSLQTCQDVQSISILFPIPFTLFLIILLFLIFLLS